MSENDFTPNCESGEVFKEAVCIDAMRIYDSCSAKDCIEDVRVLFPTETQALIDSAVSVRVRDIDVLSVYIDMQPIPFNRGYYSIDMTFFFDVCLEVSGSTLPGCERIRGVSVFNKKAILYGSEGNAKVFSSDECEDIITQNNKILPKATVQVAKPVALSVKLCDCSCRCGCEPYSVIPECIARQFPGTIDTSAQGNCVYVTIGLFTIVQIIRNVQILIPAFDYCIPEKECVSASDNPCELFRKIEFPTDEFFPPKAYDQGCSCTK